ncbi:MAG: hypothetical protein WC562_03785 [Dehalococcoidia bacterium]
MRIKLVLALFLVLPVIFSGCGSSPKSTSNLTAQELLSNSLSAMADTISCFLHIEAQDQETWFPSVGDKTPVTNTLLWNGTSITGNNGTKEITMNQSYQDGFVVTVFNLSVADGEWSATQSEGAQEIDWSPVFTRNGSCDKWVSSDQYPQQIALMETATEVIMLSDETVNGVECYTLKLVPSRDAMINWVYSLEQPMGDLNMGWFGRMSIDRTREVYDVAYKNSSSVTVWVDKRNYQVIRTNISAFFEALPQYLTQGDFSGGPISSDESPDTVCTTMSCAFFYKVDRAFYSQIEFSDFSTVISD